MVLTPTAGPSGGAYVFTMSLFSVDFAKNTSTKVADVGDFGLPPELAAGYPATSYGENMYAILGGKVHGGAIRRAIRRNFPTASRVDRSTARASRSTPPSSTRTAATCARRRGR